MERNLNSNREIEKQRSRDEDARRLAAGEISEQELKRENNFFAALDMKKFEMVAIGGKQLGGVKKVSK